MGYVVEHVSNDEFNTKMVCKDGKVMFFHTCSMYTMIKIQNLLENEIKVNIGIFPVFVELPDT